MNDATHTRPQQREEAFDLFCTGLTLREVHGELTSRYPGEAPSLTALKRWSSSDNWVARRRRIRGARQEQQDQARILYGMDYIAELTRIRRKLLTDAAQQDTHAAAQAIYALAALEKLLGHLLDLEQDIQRYCRSHPGFVNPFEQLEALLQSTGTPTPLPRSTLPDEAP